VTEQHAAHPGHRGTRAIQRMVEHAPSTGGLALWVHHHDLPATLPAPAAPLATDGMTLHYAPAFEALPLPEQAGQVAHAVLHVALRHVARQAELQQLLGDVDAQLYNTCADAIVNSTLAHLAWLRLPPNAVRLERLLASALGVEPAADAALLEWDVERLYREIDDRRPRKGRQDPNKLEDGPRAARVRALAAGTPQDLLPVPAEGSAAEAQAEQAREWRERLLRAHANDGESSLLRVLLADLPSSRTPWEQLLRTRLAHGLSRRPAISWSRPSRSYLANQGRGGPHRRLPWEPGFSGSQLVPRLALMVDVSGSIDAPLLERFSREVEAITRRQEAALVLVIGDDCVRRVVHYEPGRVQLRGLEFDGGGGTDFTPLLQEADRHRPDIGIVLTDLDGPAHFRPRWPVIWAVPEAHDRALAPFGRKISLR
jgi:hypothetical protein